MEPGEKGRGFPVEALSDVMHKRTAGTEEVSKKLKVGGEFKKKKKIIILREACLG